MSRRHSDRFWLLPLFVVVLVVPSAAIEADGAAGVPSDNESLSTQETSVAPDAPCRGGIVGGADGWRLQKASVGATMVSATNSQQAYKANVITLRRQNATACGSPHQQTKADFNIAYDARQSKSRPGSTVNRIGNLQLQQLWFTGDNANYWVANADSFHNSSIGVYFQQALGFGRGRITGRRKMEPAGERLVSTTEIFADLRVVHQRFYDHESEQLVGALLNLRHAYVTRKAVIYSVTLQAQPAFNNTDAWQAGAVIEVIGPLTDTIGLSVAAFDTYVNNAPDKYEKNYLSLTVGLAYTPKPR